MIFSFKNFLRGYLSIEFFGEEIERYLNLCSKNHILIWNIRKTAEGISCYMTIDGYKASKPFMKKTKTKGKIREKNGLPFYLFRYRRRWFFAVGCLVSLLLLYLASGFIWRIEICGNSYVSDERILQLLEKNHWFYGDRIGSFSTEDVEKTLRENLPDAIWVSADLTGTCLTVSMKENLRSGEEKKEENTRENTGYDLIATADGIVDSIVTRNGTPMVKAGDEVKSGDILISGVVEFSDGTTEEVRKQYCEADGDVSILSMLTYEDSFPMEYKDKVFTGREISYFLLCPHQGQILKTDWIKPYDRFDILTERKQLTAGNGYFLPFDLIMITKKEYEIQTLKRSKEDAKEKVKQDFSFHLKNLREKGIQTLEKNVMISYMDDSCYVTGNIKVIQKMTQKQPTPVEIAVEEENNSHEL